MMRKDGRRMTASVSCMGSAGNQFFTASSMWNMELSKKMPSTAVDLRKKVTGLYSGTTMLSSSTRYVYSSSFRAVR